VDEREHVQLGMDRPIARRDFLGGVALIAGLGSTPSIGHGSDLARAVPVDPAKPVDPGKAEPAIPVEARALPENYPPALTGLRGQYPGSFEDAHKARDGGYKGPLTIEDETGETYDLVIVGAGISGLAAAHFFQRYSGGDSKVLVLDNHDDFGGHAKRNEFRHGGKIYLASGGTLDIDTPYYPYSYTARALLAELGVDVASYAAHLNDGLYRGLGEGVFFDRGHFGADRLVAGIGEKSWKQFFTEAPLGARVRAELIRLHTETIDYLPALDPVAKAELLKRISYQTFLLEHARLHPDALPYFGALAFRNNKRVDTCPAYEAALHGSPGFGGMKIDGEPFPDPHFFYHFPDGNSTIARLLVNRLVPAAWGRQLDMESVALALVDYARLDAPDGPTRIRLRSTVVRVEHEGAAQASRSVQIVYARGGRLARVRAHNVVLACTNNIIRYLVPDLPERQRTALAYASKVPMQYTNVLLRGWRPWVKLGVQRVIAPSGYHTELELVPPVSMGSYHFSSSPDEPVIVRLTRNPNHPGLPRKAQQALGRQDMLSTPFERIELEVRSQLQRVFGSAGFEASRDILGITVNRWPHGYAYTYDTLGDPPFEDAEYPHVIGRQRFGRISIANADAGAAAFTNEAIDQAHRAVQDLLFSRHWV